MAYVQGKYLNGSGASSYQVTFDSNCTAGNFLSCAVREGGAQNAVVFSDSQSNTWSNDKQQNTSVDSLAVGHAANCAAGSTTVTINFGANASCRASIQEYSGLDTSSPLDKTASATGTSPTPNSGNTATTSQADELLIGAVCQYTGSYTITEDANFTNRFNVVSKYNYGDRIVSSTGQYAYAPTFSSSDEWGCVICTYKAAISPMPKMMLYQHGG